MCLAVAIEGIWLDLAECVGPVSLSKSGCVNVTASNQQPRTLLLCHHDMPLHSDGIARWLSSWSSLEGIVVIQEPRRLLRRRLRREISRVGLVRLVDVLAQRLYYRLFIAKRDAQWVESRLSRLRTQFPLSPSARSIRVASPNSAEAQRFIEAAQPDFVLALCKNMLAERIYAIPSLGTFVLHPGICPEYRNSHGCFWALASNDLEKVGMTMLRIDRGIDTGPVFGYFTAPYDEVAESHVVIQHRMTFDNLDAIAALFMRISSGHASPISTRGRESREWGQPWLTRYLSWKRQAKRRRNESHHA